MATKKHKDFTVEEAQRAGMLLTSNSAEADLFRARKLAQRRFDALANAEAEAGRPVLASGFDKRGKSARDEQARADAQLVGLYGDPRRINDPSLRQQVGDARARLRAARAMAEAPAALARAQADYDAAVSDVESRASRAVEEARQQRITALQAELHSASERARHDPAAAPDVQRLAGDLQKLTTQST